MVEGILPLGPEAVTASFVDVLAEHDPERLGTHPQDLQDPAADGGGVQPCLGILADRRAVVDEAVRQDHRAQPDAAAVEQALLQCPLLHLAAEPADRPFLDRHHQLVMGQELADQVLVQRLGEAGIGHGHADPPGRQLAGQHYAEHRGKPFFGPLVEFITSGPVLALAVTGESAISVVRAMMGATNPLDSAPGTIRGDYALELSENIVHGSDSKASARRELALFFPDGLV